MKTLKTLLMLGLALVGLTLASPARAVGARVRSYILYIGGYTRETGKGIYAYRFTPATADLTPLGLIQPAVNPSWLTAHPAHRVLYAASEFPQKGAANTGDSITAYFRDAKSGALSVLGAVASGGQEPVQLAIDRAGKVLVAANFGGAGVAPNLASFPIRPDGSLGAAISVMTQEGKAEWPGAPHDQNGLSPTDSHDHCVMLSPDDRFAFACNLGLGKIFAYRLNADAATLAPAGAPFVVPGLPGLQARPHHLVFHPNSRFAYILDSKMAVVAVGYEGVHGRFKAIQTVPLVAANGNGSTLSGSEIITDRRGRFVYASSRAIDASLKSLHEEGSVDVLAANPETGRLTLVQHMSSGGDGPRTFAFDPSGQYLFLANQLSGAVIVFAVDHRTGRLTPTGKVLKDMPEPSSFVFEADR